MKKVLTYDNIGGHLPNKQAHSFTHAGVHILQKSHGQFVLISIPDAYFYLRQMLIKEPAVFMSNYMALESQNRV